MKSSLATYGSDFTFAFAPGARDIISAGRRVWYIADLTYETRDDIYVNQIIDEPADPATDAIFRCEPEPGAMIAARTALPTVGASLAGLNEYYGTKLPEYTSYVRAHAQTDILSKIAYYRLANGTVDAVSIAGGYFESDDE